jgi:putative membrane protein
MKHVRWSMLMLLPLATAAFAAGEMADQKFVDQATQGSLAEIEAGKLASQKGSSEAVRSFGQQMVSDHEKNSQMLKSIVASKGLKQPTETDTMHKAMKKQLESESGASFDKTYMKGQVSDHEKMAKLMQQQSEKGNDPQLKAFAAQTLPVVQQHLEMARKLAQGAGDSHASH